MEPRGDSPELWEKDMAVRGGSAEREDASDERRTTTGSLGRSRGGVVSDGLQDKDTRWKNDEKKVRNFLGRRETVQIVTEEDREL